MIHTFSYSFVSTIVMTQLVPPSLGTVPRRPNPGREPARIAPIPWKGPHSLRFRPFSLGFGALSLRSREGYPGPVVTDPERSPRALVASLRADVALLRQALLGACLAGDVKRRNQLGHGLQVRRVALQRAESAAQVSEP